MAEYYYNLQTRQVEEGRVSSGFDRMGPYPTYEEARAAMEKAQERTEAWEKADEEWKDAWEGEGEDQDDWDDDEK